MPRGYGFDRVDWISPLLHQIDRQGSNIMYADEARRRNEAADMQKQAFALQLQKYMSELDREAKRKQMLSQVPPGADINKLGMFLLQNQDPAGLELMVKAAEIEARKKEAGYEIKPNKAGEYVRIPKTPGGTPEPTGVLAEQKKWEAYPPNQGMTPYQEKMLEMQNRRIDLAEESNRKKNEELTEYQKQSLKAQESRSEAQRIKPMPASMLEDLNGIDQVLKIFEEIEGLYYGKKNEKPGSKWVGPIDSAMGAVGGKIDALSDKDEQKFRALVQQQFNIQGKLRAGSAWTAPEIARLMAELPSTGSSETAFEARLDSARNMLESKKKTIIENAKEKGYRVSTTEKIQSSGKTDEISDDEILKQLGIKGK